jgi:predicted CXXCH cytochrome family protein
MQGGAHAASADDITMACIDCHGAHDVQQAQAPTLRATTLAVCTGCHQDRQLMEAYGVSTNVVTTYLRDFHGRTSLLKAKTGTESWIEEAVCTDCHGAHSIPRVDDENSKTLKSNLTITCQECHAGATPNFPDSWMSHYEPTPEKTPLVFLAQGFYWIMIPFTIGGLLVHVGIDLRHKIKTRKTAQEGARLDG